MTAEAIPPPTIWEIPESFEPGLISVVTTTFDRAALLRRAMASVRAQTYRPIEHIISDDGSSDDTRAVVEQFAQDAAGDAGYSLRHLHQPNRGNPAALNRGFSAARGEWFQILDSDDAFPPERLAIVTDAARLLPGCELAVTGREVVDARGRHLRFREPLDLSAPDRLRRALRHALWPGSALIRRTLVRRIGPFNEALSIGVDWEHGVNAALACDPAKVLCLDRPLAFYYVHGGPRLVSRRNSLRRALASARAVCERLRRAGYGATLDDLVARRMRNWYLTLGCANDSYLRAALAVARSPRLRAALAARILLHATSTSFLNLPPAFGRSARRAIHAHG